MLRRLAALVGLVVFAVFGLFFGPSHGTTEAKSTATPSASASANETTDPVTGLPIVSGGNPAEPINGNASNADVRTPVVRAGDVVKTWAGLDALLGSDKNYTTCADKTVNMDWGSDVPKFKSTESATNDPRYILAVNTTASDEAVRKIASESVGEDLSGLKILRVDEIVNTRGFTTGGCQEFLDRRPMVRVSLGKFVFNTDGSVKGLQSDTGIFVDCHNPWRLPTTTKPPTTKPPTTTAPPTTCAPTVCLESKGTAWRTPGDSGKGADVGTGTKPPAKVTTPAEATPPPVATTQTGGNGVVDTPTAPLGSQTGVTAPGATPAPTTPATPPPNEGGGVTGVVSGF